VAIPVSAARSIEVSYESDEKADLCATVSPYAKAAVTKLRKPDSVAMNPASRPFAAWDGCSLLTQVLGKDADRYRYKPKGSADPFAGCESEAHGNTDTPGLEVAYDAVPTFADETRKIAGRTVDVDAAAEHCSAKWDNGPNGNRNKWFAHTVVTLRAGDCDTAARLAERTISLAAQRPADANASPQRPLLYGTDDNDTTTKGACVDLADGDDDDCEPYQKVDVPDDPAAIMAAAEANRHVQCAVFKNAMDAEFGPSYAPVTLGADCIFVAPDHKYEITVDVDAVSVPDEYGKGGRYGDQQNTKIAGKPAISFWSTDQDMFDVYLSPNGDLAAPGNLHIGLIAMGGRGTKSGNDIPVVDKEQTDKAAKVMSRVVRKYFA
jgi:hypothetical protein